MGGPPCYGFSDTNQNKSEDNSRRLIPARFIELAADLSPEWIMVKENPAARELAVGWVGMLRGRGYASKLVMLSEMYGVPQRR